MSTWRRLPTLRQLTARLRALNEAFAHPEGGPGSVCLYLEGSAWDQCEWVCGCGWEGIDERVGPEEVPGSAPFDAVAAARRLLADARAKGVQMTVYVLIEDMGGGERDVRGVYSTEAAALAAADVCKAEDGSRSYFRYGVEPHVLGVPPEPFV